MLVSEVTVIRNCTRCGQKNRIAAVNLTSRVRCGACKTELEPIAKPIDADANLFDEIVNNARVPVLVDFWAAWCGPRRMAAPEVEHVAQSNAGKAIVLKVDTDAQPAVAERYHVRGIPFFVVFRDGRIVSQQAGVVARDQLQRWLDAAAGAAV